MDITGIALATTIVLLMGGQAHGAAGGCGNAMECRIQATTLRASGCIMDPRRCRARAPLSCGRTMSENLSSKSVATSGLFCPATTGMQ